MLPAMRFAFLVLILSACGRSGAEDSGEREGACGEPSEVDLTLKVAVHDSDGIGLVETVPSRMASSTDAENSRID